MSTNDPAQKLGDARHLATQQDRPLIAERLIREAIEACRQRDDPRCLGEALYEYGAFFLSAGVKAREAYYRKNGFLDEEASYETRAQAAIRHFKSAAPFLKDAGRFDALANTYLNIGDLSVALEQRDAACFAYDESANAHALNVAANPSAKVIVEGGGHDFLGYLRGKKEAAQCP